MFIKTLILFHFVNKWKYRQFHWNWNIQTQLLKKHTFLIQDVYKVEVESVSALHAKLREVNKSLLILIHAPYTVKKGVMLKSHTSLKCSGGGGCGILFLEWMVLDYFYNAYLLPSIIEHLEAMGETGSYIKSKNRKSYSYIFRSILDLRQVSLMRLWENISFELLMI